MAWDKMDTETFPCPCGSSTYTVTQLMDDWNRSDEEWSMQCPRCKDVYCLKTIHYSKHGMDETTYKWVPKDS
jgi:hypothetical protein